MLALHCLIFAVLIDLTYQSHWTYHDEQTWAEQCESGREQSPINIESERAVVDLVGERIHGPLVFRGYKAVDVLAVNNGHTLKWSPVPGSPAPTLSGGPLQGNYTLLQFHLHWLSEHALDGVKFLLEIHMVHVKTGVPIEEAIKMRDGLAVVGVFVQVEYSENNEFALEEIMTVVPDLTQKTEEDPTVANIIDMTRLLGDNPQAFYTYEGSLTTPECQEAVTWIVIGEPIVMSDEQYKKLSRVDIGGTANFRAIQPLNDRTVYRSIPSCAALLTPGLLTLITSLYQGSTGLWNLAKCKACKMISAKRRFFGKQDNDCY